jgi:hypothetical protein
VETQIDSEEFIDDEHACSREESSKDCSEVRYRVSFCCIEPQEWKYAFEESLDLIEAWDDVENEENRKTSLVRIQIMDLEVSCLVDTGSEACLCSWLVWRRLSSLVSYAHLRPVVNISLVD